ncbi:MAG: TIGR02281 family clan AA aspartic protease [Chitinophagales bacterium]
MRKAIFIIVSIFMSAHCDKLKAQQPLSPYDINDLKDIVKKEDFDNLSKFLKANDFVIKKSNLNYNHGSYYVIAEIECERKLPPLSSKRGSFLDVENKEQLTINFHEYDDFKQLTISEEYISVDNDFLKYYDKWKSLNWTYVRFGDLYNGYQLGEIGTMGPYGNSLKKVFNDSIILKLNGETGNPLNDYGMGSKITPKYKSMRFRNDNENLGIPCNYLLELNAPWPKNEFYLLFTDTAYSLYLNMDEYYPKFVNQTNHSSVSKTKTIQLIKSGKTYFINISIGAKKKKYVLDSGASDFTIDESSYKQLLESGNIKIKHKLPDGEYQMADGSIKTYKRTLIPEINIGNIKIENIAATVVPDGQPLLLGKSVLDNFKTWKIDNSKNVLIIETD